MIIGVTGTLGAGKGTISHFLVERGFKHYSVRGFISNEIEKRGLEINRDNMVLVGNDLRMNHGPSHIVEKLYEMAQQEGANGVIESVRAVGEIEDLRKRGKFILIAVDANPRTRYERAVKRKSITDGVSFDRFMEDERREMFSADPHKQNISKCISMADFKILNDGTFEELKKDVEEILEGVGFQEHKAVDKYTRPSWDEYFMDIARAVAKRATCDRGRSGCVITKDKRILVTGYVGSPVGVKHCDEVGHQMKTVTHEDGSQSQHCVRTTHAEQNAICQAAKMGISIDGATLYCKMTPCDVCAKMIVNSGIKRVVPEKGYHGAKEAKELFKQAGVQLDILDEKIEQYEKQ